LRRSRSADPEQNPDLTLTISPPNRMATLHQHVLLRDVLLRDVLLRDVILRDLLLRDVLQPDVFPRRTTTKHTTSTIHSRSTHDCGRPSDLFNLRTTMISVLDWGGYWATRSPPLRPLTSTPSITLHLHLRRRWPKVRPMFTDEGRRDPPVSPARSRPLLTSACAT